MSVFLSYQHGFHPYVIVDKDKRAFKLYGQRFTMRCNCTSLPRIGGSYYTTLTFDLVINSKPFLIIWSVLNGSALKMTDLTFAERMMVWRYADVFGVPTIHPFREQWISSAFIDTTTSDEYLTELQIILLTVDRRYLIPTCIHDYYIPSPFVVGILKLVPQAKVDIYYPMILSSMAFAVPLQFEILVIDDDINVRGYTVITMTLVTRIRHLPPDVMAQMRVSDEWSRIHVVGHSSAYTDGRRYLDVDGRVMKWGAIYQGDKQERKGVQPCLASDIAGEDEAYLLLGTKKTKVIYQPLSLRRSSDYFRIHHRCDTSATNGRRRC